MVVYILTASSILYAQNESPKQPNNVKNKDAKGSTRATKEFIRVNKTISQEIGKAANAIDRGVSPPVNAEIEENKTQIYFIVGGDFSDNGDIDGNFRYGAQLHLPRFEKYWKLKFDNQDENRNRGSSAVIRQRRERDYNDDIFLGVSLMKTWKGVDVDYKPKINLKDGFGLDHSIEANTKFEFGKFHVEPALEFFANHDEGAGASSVFKLRYWFVKKFAVEQGNDARFLFLNSDLAVNHYAGFLYLPSDRLHFTLHYFRSFSNEYPGLDYILSAYGGYLGTQIVIYKDMLGLELRPYIVFERAEKFKQVNGMVVNFKITF